eukprot:PhF_6_TR11000/c0_g1_i1/m.17807
MDPVELRLSSIEDTLSLLSATTRLIEEGQNEILKKLDSMNASSSQHRLSSTPNHVNTEGSIRIRSQMSNLSSGGSSLSVRFSTSRKKSTNSNSQAPSGGGGSSAGSFSADDDKPLQQQTSISSPPRARKPAFVMPSAEPPGPRWTFAPTHILVTIVDIIYWAVSVFEVGYVALHVGNYEWGEAASHASRNTVLFNSDNNGGSAYLEPSTIEIAIFAGISAFLLFCIPFRTRVAAMDRFDLIENPKELWKRYRRKWFFYDLLTA